MDNSAFHMLAYKQLASSLRHTGSNTTSIVELNEKSSCPLVNSYSQKNEWEILPHATYSGSQRSESLQDSKVRPKEKIRGNTKALDKKPTYAANKLRPQPLNQLSKIENDQIVSHIVGDDDTSPLYKFCLQDLDQSEILAESNNNFFESIDDGLDDDPDLGVGSLVEISIKDIPRYGVIKWIGTIPGDMKEGRRVAGIEMEEIEEGLTDGTFNGKRYFICPQGKALFVPLHKCTKDGRFLESLCSNPRASLGFGSTDCQPVLGSVPPLGSSEEIEAMFGRNKGIQGHQNSCYLDATLFSMFAFTSVFDSLLFRPPMISDIKEYTKVQQVLREEIVNPLRANKYVRADRIMKLRTMLDNLSSVRGLTTEEKDPEEFLHSLLAQILRAEPFLQLSSGQEAYYYQLFVEKDDKLSLPTVQNLFDQSFLTSDIKLKQVPSCLIIQMPRFGKEYKMYPRILPTILLDVTDVIEDSPRQCIICGKLAEYECKECFGHCGSSGLDSIAFCLKCMNKAHSHEKRGSHKSAKRLTVPQEFQELADHYTSIRRIYMELFAVVCIETSHYVTFTRCGSGADATWSFFDSMADRKGEHHGYNIPVVLECGDIMQLFGEESCQVLNRMSDKTLPDLYRRLLCDSYMCFYQSPKVMMYR